MKKENIKLNKNIYSGESVKQAIDAYQKNFQDKIKFLLREKNDYFELEVQLKENLENFSNEFCNYVLSINIK